MKQYFAKFLAVGGDNIEDGDFYLFDGKINQCKKSIIPELKQFYGEEWDSNWFQKVKLFLCSRDIEVNDTFWANEAFRICVDKKEGDYPYQDKQGTWHSKHWFKVMGEISPEAIWVKEGMEFDEEDIDYCFSGIYGSYSITKESFKTQGSYIRIKCLTCQKFH